MKNFKPTKIASAALNVGGHARTASRLVRQGPRPMALEQRFMFDGAALIDAVDTLDHSTPDATLMTTADVVDTPLLVVESAPAVVRTSAQEAETLVKNYLASRTDAELFALFNGGQTAMDAAWAERLESLRSALTDGSFHLNVVEMDSASQFTAIAAFAAEGPNGEPTIFINSYWFGMFESPDATRTLVEELGHAIDNYLNPNSDTAGDEGEAFADVVLDGAASADTLSALSTQSDKGTVTVAGVSYEVEFANFNFVNAYQMITDVNNDGIVQNTENWADKEQESHTLLIADAGTNANTNYGGLGAVTINDDTNSQTFSGNDVSAIGISIGGTDYYGWISRPLKIQGKVVGFYFWTDQDFTNLATAQADGNQDADSADAPNDPGVTDNKGFILVVDQSYFSGLITGTNTTTTVTGTGIVWSALAAGSYKSIEVGSSSDRVDNALNSLLTPNAVQAVADTLTVTEGSGATIGNLLTNDTDPNGDTFTLTSYNIGGTTYSGAQLGQTQTITGVGTISITSTGGYTFTPGANYSGPVPVISYTITDKYGATSTATFSINVTAVNDAPTGGDDSITTSENTPKVLSLSDFGTYSDPESDPLAKIRITELATNGTLQYWNGSSWSPVTTNQELTVTQILLGQVRFVPDANESGSNYATVKYQVGDGQAYSASAYTLSVNVTAGNQAPVAIADTNTVIEAGCNVAATPSTGNVISGGTPDSDANGGSLSVTEITAYGNTQTVNNGTTSSNGTQIAGQYGTLTIGSDGSYSYVLTNTLSVIDAMNTGSTAKTETFTYVLSDGQGGTASTSLTLTINGTNDAPVAADDFSTFIEDTNASAGNHGTVTGNVLTNDSDVDNTSLEVKLVDGTTPPGTSDVLLNASSPISSVTLAITQVSGSWTAIVPNSPAQPVWLDAAYTQAAVDRTGVQLTVYRSGSGGGATLVFSDNVALYNYENVSLYVKDPGNSNFTIVSVDITSATTTSSTTIATTADVSGIQVGYTVTGTGVPSGTTVVSVDSINKTVTLSQSVNISNIALTFQDPNSVSIDPSTQEYYQGTYGYLILNKDGGYTYTLTTDLTANQVVTEQFTYTTKDPADCVDTAVITIRVTGVDAAKLANDTLVVTEDNGAHVTFNGNVGNTSGDTLKANDLNGTSITLGDVTSFKVAGDNTTYSAGNTATITGVGTLSIAADGTIAFDPVDGYLGPVPTVTYTRTGSDNQPYTANLTITIQAVDNPSVLAPDTNSIPEDTTATGNVLANDSDVDSTLSIASYSWNNGSGTASGTVGSPTPIILNSVTVGTLTLNSNGSYSFVPTSNWNGTVPTITYTTNTGSTSTLVIEVTPVNDPPTLDLDANNGSSATGNDFKQSYTNGSTAAAIGDADTTISDVDDTNIESAQVVLVNPQTGDALNFDATTLLSSYGITASSSSAGGVITVSLSGTSTLANYQAAIRSITFSSTGISTLDRVISAKVNDGSADSNTAYTTITVSPDNRALTVTGTTVNEASPYVLFEVGGLTGQWVNLALGTTGSGAGHGNMGTDFLPNLQYFNGTSWVDYTGGPVQIPAGNTLLVRTPVLQDQTNEGAETLKLIATNMAGTAVSGNSTIVDDGTGDIFLSTNNTTTPNSPSNLYDLDDDRPLTVNDITVNEASPYGVFTVTGAANQWAQFALSEGTAKVDANGTPLTDGAEDYGPHLQYWNGSAWTNYSANSFVQLDGSGKLLVRTTIINDTPFEGSETFFLGATNTGGSSAYGTGTILDDGTGKIYQDVPPSTGPLTPVEDNVTTKNDDRTLDVVGGLTFNEASTYATFTVTGMSGYDINLALGPNTSVTGVATVSGFTFDYSLDGGTTWTQYTWNGTSGDRPMIPGSAILGGNTGTVLVRVAIGSEADVPFEGPETFTLTATYATNSAKADSDTDTIIDDGTGRLDNNGDGNTADAGEGLGGPGAGYDDDRPVVNDADLITTKVLTSGDATPDEGDTVVYTITVTNNGAAQATNVDLTESWPSGLTFVSATASQGTYSSGTGVWDIGTLNNGASVTLVLTGTVKVGEGGNTLTNSVSAATGDQNDPTSSGDDLSESVKVNEIVAPAPAPIPEPAPAPAAAPTPAPSDIPPEPLPPFNSATVMQVTSPTPPLEISTFPVEAILTSDIGFPVLVAEPGNTSLPPNLTLANGVTDQFADPGIESRFAIPFDTFAHTKADAQITLQAKQQDGTDLPSWVVFDPQSGTFTVNPPANLPENLRELKLMVIARDQEGREAVAPFRFFVGDEKAKPKAVGRLSLSEQLKLAGNRGATPWAEWNRAPVEAKPVVRAAPPAAERAVAHSG